MKSKLALAALIAAMLTLAGCGPQSEMGGAGRRARPIAGAPPATRGVIGETVRTMAIGSTEAHAFTITQIQPFHDLQALGVVNAFAFFQAPHAGDLKVVATVGKPSVYVGFPGPNQAQGRDPGRGIPVAAGWHRVDISCQSSTCIDVKVTFNGKPVSPYAWPHPAATGYLQ